MTGKCATCNRVSQDLRDDDFTCPACNDELPCDESPYDCYDQLGPVNHCDDYQETLSEAIRREQ